MKMKSITGYVIEHIESEKFVGRKNPTYAVFSDIALAYDKRTSAEDLARGHTIDHYVEWLDGPWFVNDENKAKLFDNHVHLRRVFGLGKDIKKRGETYDAYRVHGTDGTIVPLMDIFL